MMRSLIFGVLIALSAASCQQGVIYTQTLDLPLGKWQADQVLETQFASPDTTRNYDLFLDINHNEEYHYENVYLQIETLFPHKDPVTKVSGMASVVAEIATSEWSSSSRSSSKQSATIRSISASTLEMPPLMGSMGWSFR